MSLLFHFQMGTRYPSLCISGKSKRRHRSGCCCIGADTPGPVAVFGSNMPGRGFGLLVCSALRVAAGDSFRTEGFDLELGCGRVDFPSHSPSVGLLRFICVCLIRYLFQQPLSDAMWCPSLENPSASPRTKHFTQFIVSVSQPLRFPKKSAAPLPEGFFAKIEIPVLGTSATKACAVRASRRHVDGEHLWL